MWVGRIGVAYVMRRKYTVDVRQDFESAPPPIRPGRQRSWYIFWGVLSVVALGTLVVTWQALWHRASPSPPKAKTVFPGPGPQHRIQTVIFGTASPKPERISPRGLRDQWRVVDVSKVGQCALYGHSFEPGTEIRIHFGYGNNHFRAPYQTVLVDSEEFYTMIDTGVFLELAFDVRGNVPPYLWALLECDY